MKRFIDEVLIYWPIIVIALGVFLVKRRIPMELVSFGMASLRCRWCEVSWPDAAKFNYCPKCRENTEHSFLESMPDEQAHSIAAQAAFGWFIWDTDYSLRS